MADSLIYDTKHLEKKKNGQIKGTDKQYVADSLIHDTTYHTRFAAVSWRHAGTRSE